MTLLRALVKVVERNKYIGVSDWDGQFTFISWDKIIKSHPDKHDLKLWDEVYLILDDKFKVNWKEDNKQFYDKKLYKDSTVLAPEPIPLEFTQEKATVESVKRPSSNENAAIFTLLTKILQILINIDRSLRKIGNIPINEKKDLADTFLEKTHNNINKEKSELPPIDF